MIRALLFSALLWMPNEASTKPADETRGETLLPARTCPQIFGDRAARRRNRHRRRALQMRVDLFVPSIVDVTFAGLPDRPRPFTFEGVSLVDTEDAPRPAAIIHLPPLPKLGCPAGDYRVHRDDALFADTRIVAIIPDHQLILLESDATLGYLATRNAQPPIWRMSWASNIFFRPPPRAVTVMKGSKSRRSSRTRRSRRSRRSRRGRR